MAAPEGPRERIVATSTRAYRSLLRVYPSQLRDEYGDEMARCFRDLCREALEGSGGWGLAALWVRTLRELLATALEERRAALTGNVYRLAVATAFILMLPLVAMQLTDQVDWSLFDFAFAGALIFGTGLTYLVIAKKAGVNAYRLAVGLALAAAFLLIWMNLAVGLIGSEDNPANLMYGGVLAVGLIGAIAAGLRPRGMARVLFTMALAQAVVAAIAVIFELGVPWNSPVQIVFLNGFFVTLFVASALLFRSAAREITPVGASPQG